MKKLKKDYSEELKKEIAEFASSNSIGKAISKYGASRQSIVNWKKQFATAVPETIEESNKIMICGKLVGIDGLCLLSNSLGYTICKDDSGNVGCNTDCDFYSPRWASKEEAEKDIATIERKPVHRILRGEIINLSDYFKMYFRELPPPKRAELIQSLKAMHEISVSGKVSDDDYVSGSKGDPLCIRISQKGFCRKMVRHCRGKDTSCPNYVPAFNSWEEVSIAAIEKARKPALTDEELKAIISSYRSRSRTPANPSGSEIIGAMLASRGLGGL